MLYIPFQACRDKKKKKTKDSNSKTMKAFLVLSFLILLLADEALCSSREQRLSKLLEKLEAKVLSSPTKPPLIQPRKAKHNKKRVKENTPTSLLLLCMSSFLFVVLIFYTCQCSGLNVL